MSLLIYVLTFVLVLTSLFLVLVVLMQRAKTDGGMGAAMGGGITESTFGAETSNVLSKATINAAIVFFVLSFTLYLAHIYQSKHHDSVDSKLPTVVAPGVPASSSAPVPFTTTPATGTAIPLEPGASTSVPVTVAPSAATPASQPATPPPGEPKKP